MSHISAIFGTDDDQEIMTSLYLIANVSAYSQNPQVQLPDRPAEHQRPWLDSRVSVYL